MSDEILIPFQLDHTGQIAVTSDANVQIQQHVMSLLNTEPGVRPIISDYGVPLSDLLFEEDDIVVQDLVDDMTAAAATYEPGIQIGESFSVPDTGNNGLVMVGLTYARVDAPDSNQAAAQYTNTVTIGPGGVLNQAVRG